jgi:hypothetical protein
MTNIKPQTIANSMSEKKTKLHFTQLHFIVDETLSLLLKRKLSVKQANEFDA